MNSLKWGTVKDELVISGISGIFPASQNVKEYIDNLYAGVDMVQSSNNPRWPKGYIGLPEKSGTVPSDCRFFDNEFFNISPNEANLIDFQTRILIEKVHEAICDAGFDPSDFCGSKTGIFIARCFDAMNGAVIKEIDRKETTCIMQLHNARICHYFNFRGATASADCACASGLMALHQAITSLRTGGCEAAVVASANIPMHPCFAMAFQKLNMTSPDCKCKVFDQSANGYARSEAACVLFIQKLKDSRRIYARILNTKSNSDGYKSEGITFPKFRTQRDLIVETYQEIGLDPSDVDYMESHATGTQAGDPIEAQAMAEACCNGRKWPLLVGAHKSNIGHTEGCSGLCAIVKVIGIFQNKLIPQNLHYEKPNPSIKEIADGRLKPVVQNTPFEGSIVSVNNFGFGGSNVHAIIARPKITIETESNQTVDLIPTLINFCGRTAKSIEYGFGYLRKHQSEITKEFLALLNNLSKRPFQRFPYRGSLLIDKNSKIIIKIGNEIKERRPIWFIFGGTGSQWKKMAKSLMSLKIFANSIFNSHKAMMKAFEFNLLDVLTEERENQQKNIDAFVGIAAVQIALVDLLKNLDITPEGLVGHSIGELGCAYADCCLSAEDILSAAYIRGKCVDAFGQTGAMLAVGLSAEEAKKRCPEAVYITCYNSPNSVTVAGEQKALSKFKEILLKENVFVQEINTCGQAFHSKLFNKTGLSMLEPIKRLKLLKVKRSVKWITTLNNNNVLADIYCDAEYLVNNLLNPVHFYQAVKRIPTNAIIIEISPHSHLGPLLKQTLGSDISYIPLMKKNANCLPLLLSSIGELYNLGCNPAIERLYPPVQFPIGCEHQFISPMIKWKHDQKFLVPCYPDYYNINQGDLKNSIRINLQDREYSFLEDHCIDGRIIFPGVGYLWLVWKTIADMKYVKLKELPIQFEKISFHRATILSTTSETVFEINFLKTSGKFEILNSDGLCCCSGYVFTAEYFSFRFSQQISKLTKNQLILKQKDIYKEFGLRGYDYGASFQGLKEVAVDASFGTVQWTGEWISFADSMLQMTILGRSVRNLHLPIGIGLLRCDPRVYDFSESCEYEAVFDFDLGIGIIEGLEVSGMKGRSVVRKTHGTPTLENYVFVPNNVECILNKNEFNRTKNYAKVCGNLAILVKENFDSTSEFLNDFDASLKGYPNINIWEIFKKTCVLSKEIYSNQWDKNALDEVMRCCK